MATESFSLATAADVSEQARAELELVNRARQGDAAAFSSLSGNTKVRSFAWR